MVADAETTMMPKASPQQNTGLSGAVKMVVRTFLEEKHYQNLHRILADQWKNCHSLTAAVRLMEAHGVKITPEDEARLANLPEERMIDALVQRMPGQSREQFEHFFLQLSLIASTTTRLRTALENGRPDIIEEALDSAENVGIINFLLKMAVVQAGTEVVIKETESDAWLDKTKTQMGPLLMSQAEAMQSQKALAQVKAQLGCSRVEASEKTKKVLQSLASGSDSTLLQMTLTLWDDTVKKIKRENEIREEYEEQIQAAFNKLAAYKAKQLETVRNVLLRDVEKNKEELIAFCFAAFKEDWQTKKDDVEALKDKEALEAKLATFAKTTAENAKKVLARMNAGNDDGLVRMVFQAIVQFHQEYQQNKEIEDAVKAAEKKVQEFMAKRTEGQKRVIDNMAAMTDSGLVQNCFKSWKAHSEEEKAGDKLQDELDEKLKKLSMFSDRNSGAAMNVSQRLALVMDGGAIIATFAVWKKEARIDRMRRYGREKNRKKKEQLAGVKGLFKTFAGELELGLKDGTPRVEPTSPQRP